MGCRLMAKKKNKKKERTLAAKIGCRCLGLALTVLSALVLVSTFFFDPGDVSFNTAASGDVHNYLGTFGAKSADFVLSWLGWSLPLFLIAPLAWGYGFLRLKEFVHPYARIFAFVFGTFCFSVLLSLVPPAWGLGKIGGAVGVFFARHLLSVFNNIYVYAYGKYVFASVLAVLSVLSFNFAVGITYKNWFAWGRAVCRFAARIGSYVAAAGKAAFSFGRRRKSDDDDAGRVVKPKAAKERKEPKLKEEKSEKPSAEETKMSDKMSTAKSKATDDGYMKPSVNLLSMVKDKNAGQVNEKELEAIARDLENVLQEFGVNGNIVKVRPGPVVTLYELEPAPGTKTARVIGLADDIARSMSVVSVRIAVVPGSNTIGIEMPNVKRETVWLRELLEDPNFEDSKNILNVVLGKDIGGRNVYADLSKMPHLLVAGTTGSGKSVGVNSMILSLLYRMRPDECKLIMIDPKMLEFSMYNGIPHLLTPVITDPAKAVIGLKWAVREMEDRYRAMAKLNVRNIVGYNQKLKELRASGEKVTRTVQTGFDKETGQPIFEEQDLDLTPLPYIVIVVDEMADLMLVAGKEVEAAIQRLAQMARAAGLHLIMSTQRPSVDVITGTIKANFPTRISFQVTSKIDSRTILGEQGAEQLLGMGDMLYMPAGQRPLRVHGSFVKDSEVEKVVEFLKSQKEPEYVEGVTEGELNEKASSSGGAVFDKTAMGEGSDEDLYMQAVEIVRNDKKASTSYIQRKLRIGYNRAASLIDRMEEEGVISAADHVGRREVL